MSRKTSWKTIRDRRLREAGATKGYEQAALAFALAEQARTIREDKGLSQSDLAEAMGTTQSAIARLEGGGIAPTIPTLKKLADALGVELILGFNDPRADRRRPGGKAVAASRDKVRTLVANTSVQRTVARATKPTKTKGAVRTGSGKAVAKTAARKGSRGSS